jgi:hypothetical protein
MRAGGGDAASGEQIGEPDAFQRGQLDAVLHHLSQGGPPHGTQTGSTLTLRYYLEELREHCYYLLLWFPSTLVPPHGTRAALFLSMRVLGVGKGGVQLVLAWVN